MKKTALSLLFILIAQTGMAQTQISFMNALPVNEDVYSDIAGSPYLFDTWRSGKIISYLDTVQVNLEINFNGFTNSFEIRKGGEFINLDEEYYQEVVLDNPNNPEYPFHFTKYAPDDLSGNWALVYFEGEHFSVYRTFDAGLTEDEIQDVGKTIKVRTFQNKRTFYLYRDSELEVIRFKKKQLRKAFGKSDFDAVVKTNDLDIDEHADRVKLFRALNTLQN